MKPKNARKPAEQESKPEAKPASQAAKPRDRRPKAAPVMPPILLQGDAPPAPTASGPGQRYALGPATPPKPAAPAEEPGELPEAYGTQRLLLTARDPHWLYVYWDFTSEQLRQHNALSADSHLVVRVYANAIAGQPLSETHVHPESRNWFIHVGQGGVKFIATLGYYNRKKAWITLATSGATLTPPDRLSEDTSVRFANIPATVPFEQLLAMVEAAAKENMPLSEAIEQLRASGHPRLPATAPASASSAAPAFTSTQQEALAKLITVDSVRRVWIGSLEITELIRRQLGQELSSAAAAKFSVPSSPAGGPGSLASPFGGETWAHKGFWFNVNAELIIYGATEPDASVSIGGRPIKLRADGTFSYRFALPDGQYDLPAVAVSADKTDGRAAELQFSRNTDYFGDVGVHPQDPGLKAPLPANVS